MIGMLRRREMMAQSGGLLPSEYQQVEYLRNTGKGEVIELQLLYDDSDTIICDFQFMSTSNSFMFGYYNDNNGFSVMMSSKQLRFTPPVLTTGLIGDDAIKRYVLTSTKYQQVLHDVNADQDFTYSYTRSAPYGSLFPIFLGKYYTHSVYLNRSPTKRIYHFEIVDKINLIPCYRKADSKPGMYDIINDVFYTNDGGGEFVVGADV